MAQSSQPVLPTFEEEPGAEDESDLESLGPEDFAPLRVSSVDWTVGTLLDQVEANELDVDPSFQRRDAWNAVKKSRLIESLILGVPIPQIILADLPSAVAVFPKLAGWTVLDGKQRLLAIASFLRPSIVGSAPLRLRGLNILAELNGRTLEDLEGDSSLRRHVSSLRTRTIRTVLVENAQDDRVLHLIFLRLNTETVRLSPQELRQAEYPGSFTSWVAHASADSDALHRAIRVDGADFRMRDMEVLLRYFAFLRFLPMYGGNMKAFLDDTVKRLNAAMRTGQVADGDLRTDLQELEAAIDVTFEIFDELAFTSMALAGYERRFNRAVFDLMVYFFSDPVVRVAARAEAAKVRTLFEALTEESDFARWVQSTTKSKAATFGRLRRWGERLSDVLQLDAFSTRPVPSA